MRNAFGYTLSLLRYPSDGADASTIACVRFAHAESQEMRNAMCDRGSAPHFSAYQPQAS